MHHKGAPLPSMPHIEMTVQMLRQADVGSPRPPIRARNRSGPSRPDRSTRVDWEVEPDLSNATPFLAAAAVTGGEMIIPHWPQLTTQPGRRHPGDPGAHGRRGAPRPRQTAACAGPSGWPGSTSTCTTSASSPRPWPPLPPLPIRPPGCAASPICAGTRPTGWRRCPPRSTALGGKVAETADGLDIEPTPLHGGPWHSYADHRMATAGAILGLRVPGVEIEDVGTTAKTLPGLRIPMGDNAFRTRTRMERRTEAPRVRRVRRPGAPGQGLAPAHQDPPRTPGCASGDGDLRRSRAVELRARRGSGSAHHRDACARTGPHRRSWWAIRSTWWAICRASPTPWPASSGSPIAQRCCGAPPMTPIRSSASSSPTPNSCSSSSPWPIRRPAPDSWNAPWPPPTPVGWNRSCA